MENNGILWVSRYVAYDKVRHAGGQNFNYYLKRMSEEDTKITMLAFCTPDERDKIDAEKYGIEAYVFSIGEECNHLQQKINNYSMRYSPFNRHGNFCDNYAADKVITFIKDMPKEQRPDVVILHWTEMALLATEIRKILPEVKVIAVEEDVAFLGIKRSAQAASNIVIKALKTIKYNRLKKEEIKQLKCADIVFTTNRKDENLLRESGIINVKTLSSFYHAMDTIKRICKQNYTILFYGAMNREENYKAAIWFIENVFYNIDDRWEFYVIGNMPVPDLLKFASDRVHITGYVEKIEPYFEKASCLVAPLLTGAGIKIKIIEAMSSGIPVLTNSIGIEGIPAVDRVSYYHCNSAEDYIMILNQMSENYNAIYDVGINGKKVIEDNFNYDKSFNLFLDAVMS